MLDEFARLALEDEVEYMDTSETPWYWYYKAKCGVWHRVEVIFIYYKGLMFICSWLPLKYIKTVCFRMTQRISCQVMIWRDITSETPKGLLT